MATNRVRAVQERRRSNAAGPHRVTRQDRDAAIAQALRDDPITGVRMRRYVTAVEEAEQDDREDMD